MVIRGCNEYIEDKSFSIPDGSFPRLTSLTLSEIYIRFVADLMAVKSLVNNLNDLSICHWFEEENEEEQITWFEEAIPLLLLHTPNLKRLHYDATYNPSPFAVDLVVGPISYGFLQRTSDMKLETIFLAGLQFATIESLENMPAAWSAITELCVVHGFINTADLHYFAELPSLQSLTLQLGFSYDIFWPIFDGRKTGNALHYIMTTDDRVELDPGVNALTIIKPAAVQGNVEMVQA
ncbi:hypothetical protein FRC07_005762 [Ceratobasidium sp. 392]|nr:hypothetical protein FRC07_005762 [Ceratobasidium sp. 392]